MACYFIQAQSISGASGILYVKLVYKQIADKYQIPAVAPIIGLDNANSGLRLGNEYQSQRIDYITVHSVAYNVSGRIQNSV